MSPGERAASAQPDPSRYMVTALSTQAKQRWSASAASHQLTRDTVDELSITSGFVRHSGALFRLELSPN